MRIFEILILGTLILTLAAHFWPVAKRPFWTNYFPGAAILMIVVHLATVGYRWQIAPTYALAILLFLLSIPQLLGIRIGSSAGRSRKMLNRIGMALILVCFALAAALPVWFPLFEMPNPTGPYAVGTTSFTITDESRPEIFTADPNDKRLIYVQVWYPARSTDGATRAPMWIYPEEVISTMAKEFLVPEIALSHLASVKSHSTFDAPLAEQEAVYPILVYSHGYDAGFFAQNMVQMEQLASNGYVIFSIGHAYESSLVLDTQGRAIPVSEMQKNAFYKENKEANKLYRMIFSTTGAEQKKAARIWMAATPISQQSTQIWTQDTQFLFTQIEQMNSGLGDFSLSWSQVQPEVARFSRICTYDRAGYGWSDIHPVPRTAQQVALELHTLLNKANIEGPYVLVGHSLGGAHVRMYTNLYPEEVTGIVLVDAMHEDVQTRDPQLYQDQQQLSAQWSVMKFMARFGILRMMGKSAGEQSLPAYIKQLPVDKQEVYMILNSHPAFFETALGEWQIVGESCQQLRKTGKLGDLPLVVLTKGIGLENDWQTLQDELALLSTNSKHVKAEGSGHFIQLERPDLVIAAIQQVVDQSRSLNS